MRFAGSCNTPSTERQYNVVRLARIPTTSLRLSIIIPSYNTRRYLLDAVWSVLRQSVTDLEVVVVDDGSSDGSVDLVRKIDDPRITCVQQKNRGLAGARNTGISVARARFLGFCDSDDVWHPNKAEEHLAVLQSDPSIGVTFSYSAYLDENGKPNGQLLLCSHEEVKLQELLKRNHLGNGSTPIVRRECLEYVGGFDETLRTIEDYDLWLRIAAHTSFRIRLIPNVLTGYRLRSSGLSYDYDQFLCDAFTVTQGFRALKPDLPDCVMERAYAEMLRIASRKALLEGNDGLSRNLLFEACSHCHALPLTDVRAFALTFYHLLCLPLPTRLKSAVFRLGSNLLSAGFGVYGRLRGLDTLDSHTLPTDWCPSKKSGGLDTV